MTSSRTDSDKIAARTMNTGAYLLGVAMLSAGCGVKQTASLPIAPAPQSSQYAVAAPTPTDGLIADHRSTSLEAIPAASIRAAIDKLHIAYGHTSHGSQIVDGLMGLMKWRGAPYLIGQGGLDLRDTPFQGASDLGNPDRTSWAGATRRYLSANRDVNVVMWSWCGQVSGASSGDIDGYLRAMASLEKEFPRVRFVYMTGHLDGSGANGNLHQRNEQIRAYCRANGKALLDFSDIERFDPDGRDYLAKGATDGCDYDSDGDGRTDRNWATDWQSAHPGKWYECGAAHSQPLNANRKAYAAWWLFARLGGWTPS